VDIIRAAAQVTGYAMRLAKTTGWNLPMSPLLLSVLGCRLRPDGAQDDDIKLLGSPFGSVAFFIRLLKEKQTEMAPLAGLVQELSFSPHSYHDIRVWLAFRALCKRRAPRHLPFLPAPRLNFMRPCAVPSVSLLES
jgi:hypothetical protein